MGGLVCRLFALVADFLSSLSSSSTGASTPASPTSSSNVPASGASSSSTSRTTPASQSRLKVLRNPTLATADALFGDMDYDGTAIGVTMERTAVAIPEGSYLARKRDSVHFGMRVVGIDVPNRTNIEIHPANFPLQLEGCVAVGENKDGDALDNSKAAFDRMMTIVPENFTVEVSSL
jgi:hypothetical protein